MAIDKKKEKKMVIKSNSYPYSKCISCAARFEKNFLIKNWCNLCNIKSNIYVY